MKTIFFKTAFIFFITLFFNCEEKNLEEQLPPITQTGANTFGAIVDGNVFVPKTSNVYRPPGGSTRKALETYVGFDFSESEGDDKWYITTFNSEDRPTTWIYIYIPTLLNSPKTHVIGKSDINNRNSLQNAHIFCTFNQNNLKYLSFEESGILEFSKIDFKNGIYSGVFSVKLKNESDENDIIEITDGRFDINLNTVNQ